MFRFPRPFPKVIIFLLDLFIVLSIWAVAEFFWLTYLQKSFTNKQFLFSLLPVFFFNTALFVATNLYSGIVRFTGSHELLRVLIIAFSGTVLLYNYHDLFLNFPLTSFFPFWLTYFTFVSLGLFSYRILVKYGFRYLSLYGLKETNVVIFGAGAAGVTVKEVIDRSLEKNFFIRAFVDERETYHHKLIDGIPILSFEQFKKLNSKISVDRLIVSSLTDNQDLKTDIITYCMDEGIDIQKVPPNEFLIGKNVSVNQFPRLNIEELLERKPIVMEKKSTIRAYRNKIILLTGAAGSIGSELARQLLLCKPKLLILVDQAETPLNDFLLELGIETQGTTLLPFLGSVTDAVRMELVFSNYKPEIVFHAAAYKHVPMMEAFPTESLRVNVIGTKLLADLAIKYDTEKFIMISSDKAVNPSNVMGASKRLAEMYIQSLAHEVNFSTQFITTRFGNVLGSNGSVVNLFKAQIEAGGPVTVTHPEINRFFMTVSEASQLVLEAGYMSHGGEVFVFDMGKPVLISDLAKKMIILSGHIPNKDIHIEYCGLRPGEKLYEELLHNKEETLKTYHEKIMIAKVRVIPFKELIVSFNTLIDMLQRGEKEINLVRWMKALVPEFKSNNSEFEKLDRHISCYNGKHS